MMQHSTRVTTTSRPKRGKPILVSVLVILGVTMLVAGVFLWAFHGSGSPAGTGGSIASPEPSPTFTSKVDADIAARPQAYLRVISKPDPNIDFRRTGVLDVFFATYGVNLGTDIHGDDWEQGDIVVFEHNRHIGVVSDRRDRQGLPLIIHNMGQKQRENDYFAFRKHMAVTGHYRFDASHIPPSVVKPWSGPLPR